MAEFVPAVELTLRHEGGFYKDEQTGEISNYGISARFLHAAGLPSTEADVRALTRDGAMALYQRYFWNPNQFVKIDDQTLAAKAFDLAVNMGSGKAIKLLQKAANNLLHADVDIVYVDGVLGPKSLLAINSLPSVRLLSEYRSLATQMYRTLALQPHLKKNLPGWLTRLAT